jgi:hypothetical protein
MFTVALRKWAYNLSGFNKYGKSEFYRAMLVGMILSLAHFDTGPEKKNGYQHIAASPYI